MANLKSAAKYKFLKKQQDKTRPVEKRLDIRPREKLEGKRTDEGGRCLNLLSLLSAAAINKLILKDN